MMNKIKTMLIIVIMICLYIAVDHLGNRYILTGTVTEATETGCLIVDENGEGWYWEEEGWSVGDNVEMTMHTRETQTIYDDEMLKVKPIE